MSTEPQPAAPRPGPDAPQPELVQTDGVRPRREQRPETRVVSMFRLAKLFGAGAELCLIRNISAHGLKLELLSVAS